MFTNNLYLHYRRMSELSDLTISKLFGNNKKSGKITVNTIYKNNILLGDYEFKSESLLEENKIKVKKLDICHHNIYRACCNQITAANHNEQTEIIFFVPEFVAECPTYDTLVCLNFIKAKLKEQQMDTYILPDCKSIFITWHNIEQKLINK